MANEKNKIVDIMVKNGANRVEAKLKVNKLYSYVSRVYPDASIKSKAEIISTLGM